MNIPKVRYHSICLNLITTRMNDVFQLECIDGRDDFLRIQLSHIPPT